MRSLCKKIKVELTQSRQERVGITHLPGIAVCETKDQAMTIGRTHPIDNASKKSVSQGLQLGNGSIGATNATGLGVWMESSKDLLPSRRGVKTQNAVRIVMLSGQNSPRIILRDLEQIFRHSVPS
jgi:hypothetical protein